MSRSEAKFGMLNRQTNEFYVVKAETQEQFKNFLRQFDLNLSRQRQNNDSNDNHVEQFNDFEYIVEQIRATSSKNIEQQLIKFDL